MRLKVPILAIFLITCSTDSNSIIDNRPVSNGIFVTNEMSPSPYQIWGEPTVPNGTKSQIEGYALEIPYPNPADGNMNIQLSVPNTILGRVWLEKARWVNEKEQDYADPFVMEILNQEFQEGDHLIVLNDSFNCGGEDTGTLEEGFHRVYFETEDFYYWRDIYITGYLENTPEGISDYTFNFCDNYDW